MRKYENVSVKKLKPYEKNARTHSEEQVAKIVRSIEEFGFINPVLIDGDFGIIAGHGRVMAAKKMGMEEVPCLFVEDLTEAQKRAYIIADNKLALDAGWDEHILQLELAELQEMDFDITLTGFELEDLEDNEPEEVVEDNYEAEPPAEPRTKLGDIWQLGRHRLMCGDSTDKETVELLMDGNKADMVFTDPPYNINFQGTMSCTSKNGEIITMKDGYKPVNAGYDDIKNDMKPKEEFKNFINAVLKTIKKYCIGGFYICFSSSTLDELLLPLIENDMKWKSIIIYNKNQSPLGGGDFRKKYEPICYGYFNHNFYGQPYSEDDVWDIQRTLKNDLHPTMKPIPLIAKALEYSSLPNGKVLDLFGGSGSTLIACEQLDRTYYMMELDPKYCDVIIDRWEQFTGEKAVLLNG